MAKSTMALGQFRGKMGGLVFRKGANGQQVISAYQPVVKNPRTEQQMLVRSRFNLATQVAKNVPDGYIYSLGGSPLRRQSALRSSLIKNATAQVVNGQYVASVTGANVVISKGVSAATLNPVLSYDNAQESVVVSWNDISGTMGWDVQDKVHIMFIVFSNDGSKQPVVLTAEDILSARMYTYGLPASLRGADFKVMAWVFVTRQGTEVNSASGSGASVPNTSIQASVTTGTGLSSLVYSDSMFAGSVVPEG